MLVDVNLVQIAARTDPFGGLTTPPRLAPAHHPDSLQLVFQGDIVNNASL